MEEMEGVGWRNVGRGGTEEERIGGRKDKEMERVKKDDIDDGKGRKEDVKDEVGKRRRVTIKTVKEIRKGLKEIKNKTGVISVVILH